MCFIWEEEVGKLEGCLFYVLSLGRGLNESLLILL